ncbi:hypothetical protein ACWEN3_26880, partial [Streptomyces sp. NPDC004561]
TKHTLALTNRGDATTEDLLALAREVVAGVREGVREPLVSGDEGPRVSRDEDGGRESGVPRPPPLTCPWRAVP